MEHRFVARDLLRLAAAFEVVAQTLEGVVVYSRGLILGEDALEALREHRLRFFAAALGAQTLAEDVSSFVPHPVSVVDDLRRQEAANLALRILRRVLARESSGDAQSETQNRDLLRPIPIQNHGEGTAARQWQNHPPRSGHRRSC